MTSPWPSPSPDTRVIVQPDDVRRDDDWPPRVRRRATLWVLVGVLAIWVGLPLLNRAVSPERPIPDGTEYQVGPIVFTPAEGWLLDVDRSGLEGNAPQVSVFTDGARFVIVGTIDSADALTVLDEQTELLRADDAVLDVGPIVDVRTDTGLDGVRRTFATATGQRRLTVFSVQGWAVVIGESGFGGPGSDDVTDDADSMIAALRVGVAAR
jgi:hypothetical protein